MKEVKILVHAANDEFSKLLTQKIQASQDFILSGFAKTTEDLFYKIEEEKPCLAFIDYELTGIDNGLKLVKELTSTYKFVKTIIILNEEDEGIIYKSICSGAYDYYVKNQNLSNINEKLNEVLKSTNPLKALLRNKVKKSFENVNIIENAYNLTDREKEILDLLISGITKRKMAERMVLSFHTIDSHLRNIYRKLGVQSKSQAISKALREQLVV